MTLVLTQDEWRGLLREAEHDLKHSSVQPPDTKTLELDPGAIANSIDHTLLKLDATSEQIDQLCAEAKRYDFKVQSYSLRAFTLSRLPQKIIIVFWLLSLFSLSSLKS